MNIQVLLQMDSPCELHISAQAAQLHFHIHRAAEFIAREEVISVWKRIHGLHAFLEYTVIQLEDNG